jgi:hypothetical protein
VNKRYVDPIVYLVLVSLTATMAFNFSIAERDVSWVSEVENWIRKENWEPDREYIPMMINAFFLIENGKEQFFRLYSHQEFSSYIKGLVNDVDKRVEYISREFLMNEILAKDRVLELVGRFPFDFGLLNKYGAAYFILEDNLAMNLEGTIIIFDVKGRYGVWEITNWFF